MPKSQGLKSAGHKLILELLDLIKRGKPLSPDSAHTWEITLAGVILANNKKEAGEALVSRLGLEFKTGKSPGDLEMVVYEIEVLKLKGISYAKAYEQLAKRRHKSVDRIKRIRLDYRKNHPDDYKSIVDLAKSSQEESAFPLNGDFIRLILALTHQQDK